MAVLRHGLYALTDSALLAGRLLEAVGAAIRGGAVMVQYRDKGADRARRLLEARELLALCRTHGVPLIINDDLDLALETGADGVHLGREDAACGAARAALGEEAIIGVSCYDDLERARWAAAAGADYVAFGSFFPSSVKPDAVRAPRSLLDQAKGRIAVPLVAIGGITAENGGPLVAAGADMLAVISGLFAQPDIAAAAGRFAQLYEQTRV